MGEQYLNDLSFLVLLPPDTGTTPAAGTAGTAGAPGGNFGACWDAELF